jgi:hypothetical protein
MSGQWSDLGEFSEDFQLEVLVDVLRGRVRVCWSAFLYQLLIDEGLQRYKLTATKQLTWMT